MSRTATAPAAVRAAPAMPRGNPKDSMTSTFRETKPKEQWNILEKIYDRSDILPPAANAPAASRPPVFKKTDAVPFMRALPMHRWVLFNAGVPLLLHQAFHAYFGRNPPAAAVIGFYTFAFLNIGGREIARIAEMGKRYGYLDGDVHDRDPVPDHSQLKVLTSLLLTISLRTAMAVYLAFDPTKAPSALSWAWLPLELGLYGIVLDFYYYWYHRVLHSNDSLWGVHRTHHLTKRPNPLLSLYADELQEAFDIVIIPVMTWATMRVMGMPMGFYEWWVCQQYVTFAELVGHSGLRVHLSAPNVFSLALWATGCDLVVEDHDLHHRKGWKKSHNYGKQTRLWDRIFGTCGPRIESVTGNVDYVNTATWPLY